MSDAKVGDWLVRHEYFRHIAAEVVKVTDKTVSYVEPGGWSRPSRVNKSEVIFFGAKERATALAERLTSSRARCDEEKRAADLRRAERDKALIDEWNAA